MSLLEELTKWYEEESYPPDGPELGDDVVQVAYERLGSRRWGEDIQITYHDGKDYVAVRDVEPATEMQDWGDYGKPEIYPVKPVEIKIIKYRKDES